MANVGREVKDYANNCVTSDDLIKVFGNLVDREALEDRVTQWNFEKFRVVTIMVGAGLWTTIEIEERK